MARKPRPQIRSARDAKPRPGAIAAPPRASGSQGQAVSALRSPVALAEGDPRQIRYQPGDEERVAQILPRLESEDPDYAIGPSHPLRRLYAALTEGENWGALLNPTEVPGAPGATESVWDYINSVARDGTANQKAVLRHVLDQGLYRTSRPLGSWWDRVPGNDLDERVKRALVEQMVRNLNSPAEVDAGASELVTAPSSGLFDRVQFESRGDDGSGGATMTRSVPPHQLNREDIQELKWRGMTSADEELELATQRAEALAPEMSIAAPSDASTPTAVPLPAKTSKATEYDSPKILREMQAAGDLPEQMGAWIGKPWSTVHPYEVAVPGGSESPERAARRQATYEQIARLQDAYARGWGADQLDSALHAFSMVRPLLAQSAEDNIRSMRTHLGLQPTPEQAAGQAALDQLMSRFPSTSFDDAVRIVQRQHPDWSPASDPARPLESAPGPDSDVDLDDEVVDVDQFSEDEDADAAFEGPMLFGRRRSMDDAARIEALIALRNGSDLPEDPDQAAAVQWLRDAYAGKTDAEFFDEIEELRHGRFSVPAKDRVLLQRGKAYRDKRDEFFRVTRNLPESSGKSELAQALRAAGITTQDLDDYRRTQEYTRKLMGLQADDPSWRLRDWQTARNQYVVVPTSPDKRYTEAVNSAAGGNLQALVQLLEPKRFAPRGEGSEAFAATGRSRDAGGINSGLMAARDPDTVAGYLARRAQNPHLRDSLAQNIADLYPPDSFGGADAPLSGDGLNTGAIQRYRQSQETKESIRQFQQAFLPPKDNAPAAVELTPEIVRDYLRQFADIGKADVAEPTAREPWRPEPIEMAGEGMPATLSGTPVVGPAAPPPSYPAAAAGPPTESEARMRAFRSAMARWPAERTSAPADVTAALDPGETLKPASPPTVEPYSFPVEPSAAPPPRPSGLLDAEGNPVAIVTRAPDMIRALRAANLSLPSQFLGNVPVSPLEMSLMQQVEGDVSAFEAAIEKMRRLQMAPYNSFGTQPDR